MTHDRIILRKPATKWQVTIDLPTSPAEQVETAQPAQIETVVRFTDLSAPKLAFTLAEFKRRLHETPTKYVVEGLLPARGVHVLVGDSGIGKTPFAYQLGLCVAAGKPFLGHDVRPSRVLYCDIENGGEQIVQVSDALCKYLGVHEQLSDFLIALPENFSALEETIRESKPDLVIVDTLRALDPTAEETNTSMGQELQKLHRIAREHDCAILLIHHIRKPPRDKGNLSSEARTLEDTRTLEWLNRAAGARALVNQTQTRIALDSYSGGREDVSLVMKSFVKIKGESGAIYLGRVLDEDGEPLGYRQITGVGLLGNKEQEEAFHRLPAEFTFKQAKFVYKKTDHPTSEWLKKCEAAGLLRKVSRGKYQKVADGTGQGDAKPAPDDKVK